MKSKNRSRKKLYRNCKLARRLTANCLVQNPQAIDNIDFEQPSGQLQKIRLTAPDGRTQFGVVAE